MPELPQDPTEWILLSDNKLRTLIKVPVRERQPQPHEPSWDRYFSVGPCCVCGWSTTAYSSITNAWADVRRHREDHRYSRHQRLGRNN